MNEWIVDGRLGVWFAESINALNEDIPTAIPSLIDATVAEVL